MASSPTGGTSSPSLLDRLRGAGVAQPLAASPADVAAATAAAQAAGTSLGGGDFLGGIAAGIRSAVDEAHAQEEFFVTLTRWGTVALVAIVVLVLAILAAYFLAPARTIAARAVGA